MKTVALSLLLTTLVLGGCTQPVDDTTAAASQDEIIANGSEYAFPCKNADGAAQLVITSRGDTFDVSAKSDAGDLFTATNQRPSLNVRVVDDGSSTLNELVSLDDAGQDAPAVDGPKAIELEMFGTKKALLKDETKSVSLECRFDKAKLVRFLGIKEVASPDMTNVKAVGFDIDDTLAFTTPTFVRAFATGGTPAPTDTVFWQAANACDSGCDAATLTLPDGTTKSLPANVASTAKASAKKLVDHHKAKGHKVYAITAHPDIAGDGLRDYIERELGIAREDVFFEPDIDQPGNPKGKQDRIKALDLDVFYGDSDSDITDARKAFDGTGKTIQAVRFLRSPKSSNRKGTKLAKYHPGYFGEPIIAGSYE